MLSLIFDKDYFEGSGQIGYSDYSTQHGYLEQELSYVRQQFSPIRNLLDVGCAYGYFVQLCRNAGIDAYGIDVSDYAASKFVSPYCQKLSITSKTHFLDKEFDVITCIYTFECLGNITFSIETALKEMERIAERFYFVISLQSPLPHYKGARDMYEFFFTHKYENKKVIVTDGIAFQPAIRIVVK